MALEKTSFLGLPSYIYHVRLLNTLTHVLLIPFSQFFDEINFFLVTKQQARRTTNNIFDFLIDLTVYRDTTL